MYFGFSDITVSYGRKNVLDHVTVSVEKGEFVTVCGKNGCGKTSLLKTFSGAVVPVSGEVVFEDRGVKTYPRKELAKKIAYLPQFNSAPEDIDVRTLVSYGRYPYRKFPYGFAKDDRTAVEETLEMTGLSSIAEREVRTLSGGERQRAWIAMTLCRRPEVLVLDEPAAHLDIGYQTEVMELLAKLKSNMGLTVLAVLHDLNTAAAYSDRMVILDGGSVAASGSPKEVLTEENLGRIFGIRASVIHDERAGYPYFLPLRKI